MHNNSTPGTPSTADTAAHAFIARWKGVTASELSTSQSFVIQLCELLGVAPPSKPAPLPAIDVAFKGKGPRKKGLLRILETLEALGRARQEGEGWRA